MVMREQIKSFEAGWDFVKILFIFKGPSSPIEASVTSNMTLARKPYFLMYRNVYILIDGQLIAS